MMSRAEEKEVVIVSFTINPFALSLSKSRSVLDVKGRTVLRQAQHERLRGQSSSRNVRPAFAVSRSINACTSSAPGAHQPPSPLFSSSTLQASSYIFDVEPRS